MTLPVLYQDDHLQVVNKPGGIPVHAGSGGGITVEDYFPQLQFDAKTPPQLAHRLDRDTSGCLILGRTKAALRTMGRLFEQKRVHKIYWALVNGVPPAKQGRIDFALSKQSDDPRRWHMRVDPSGQNAITDYQLLATNGTVSWLALRPKTGRTHQLRVHCAASGYPMIGDRFYGGAKDGDPPLMLHAQSVTIPFVQGAPPIIVTAPPPEAMQDMIASFNFGAAAL